MKRFLIPLLASLLAAVSCNLKDVFIVNNMEEFVTCKQTFLVSDLGNTYTVTSSAIPQSEWQQEGKRFYALFDIQNRELEINLKSLKPVDIITPDPKQDPAPEYGDPMYLDHANISGGYVNFLFQTWSAKGSDFAQRLFWEQEVVDRELRIYLYVDGNDENPAHLSDSQLEVTDHIVCLPFDTEASYRSVTLYTKVIQQKSDGTKQVIDYSFPFQGI